MVAFLFYIQRFFDPIRSLTMQYSVMQRAMASGQRITEVLDVPVGVEDRPDAVALAPDMDGSVEFRDVTFGYDPKQPVLKDVSFRVALGRDRGAGRPDRLGQVELRWRWSHRFYDVQRRRRCWSAATTCASVTQESLGRQIAMVLQEPFLFTGTVIENIRYHKAEASREEVIAAAKAVGAHDFIMRAARRATTPMLEQRGGNLSLGQRQLLSFARALVADARILVLDEATANIDSYTEMLIQKALVRLLEGRTGLVIAHRLATIRGADRIIVLQNGEMVETGNHDRADGAQAGSTPGSTTLNYASFDDLPAEAS